VSCRPNPGADKPGASRDAFAFARPISAHMLAMGPSTLVVLKQAVAVPTALMRTAQLPKRTSGWTR
jgi:hypothetical protein